MAGRQHTGVVTGSVHYSHSSTRIEDPALVQSRTGYGTVCAALRRRCARACVRSCFAVHPLFFGTVLQTDFLLPNLTVRETLQVRLFGRVLRLSPHLLCGRTIDLQYNTVRRCVASAGVK
jgi:hypothetical protein